MARCVDCTAVQSARALIIFYRIARGFRDVFKKYLHKFVPKWKLTPNWKSFPLFCLFPKFLQMGQCHLFCISNHRTLPILSTVLCPPSFVDLPKTIMADPKQAFAWIYVPCKQYITVADRQKYEFSVLVGNTEIVPTSFLLFIFAFLTLDVNGISPVSAGKVEEAVDGFDIGNTVAHNNPPKKKKAGRRFCLFVTEPLPAMFICLSCQAG